MVSECLNISSFKVFVHVVFTFSSFYVGSFLIKDNGLENIMKKRYKQIMVWYKDSNINS